MCLGVIYARRITWAAMLEVMCAISSAIRWDTMPVSVPRVCLGNPQYKGRVLLELGEWVDLQLLTELLGQEVKLAELHKLKRILQDRLAQLEMYNKHECMQ